MFSAVRTQGRTLDVSICRRSHRRSKMSRVISSGDHGGGAASVVVEAWLRRLRRSTFENTTAAVAAARPRHRRHPLLNHWAAAAAAATETGRLYAHSSPTSQQTHFVFSRYHLSTATLISAFCLRCSWSLPQSALPPPSPPKLCSRSVLALNDRRQLLRPYPMVKDRPFALRKNCAEALRQR